MHLYFFIFRILGFLLRASLCPSLSVHFKVDNVVHPSTHITALVRASFAARQATLPLNYLFGKLVIFGLPLAHLRLTQLAHQQSWPSLFVKSEAPPASLQLSRQIVIFVLPLGRLRLTHDSTVVEQVLAPLLQHHVKVLTLRFIILD